MINADIMIDGQTVVCSCLGQSDTHVRQVNAMHFYNCCFHVNVLNGQITSLRKNR